MRDTALPVTVRHTPTLDPDFVPAVLWNRAFQAKAEAAGGGTPVAIALQRPDGITSVYETRILPHQGENVHLNERYIERLVKFLLWQRGGSRIIVGGSAPVAAALAKHYGGGGARTFDSDLIAGKVCREPMTVQSVPLSEMPAVKQPAVPLGRNLDGCRIGFDLGGSDRKAAAVIDGKIVFSEEIGWDPYFERDPRYHLDGINDSLRRAAAHLPRVDAIGGSAAGIYVNNEVCVASLFRGVAEADFETRVRTLFWTLQEQWGGVPFEVANDGEVTALAAAMELDGGGILGVSMGTSQAGGYVDGDGHITPWLNELAFTPVDYRADAPIDEWSGDGGCGVQYFSQQAVARLAPAVGLHFPDAMPFPERLVAVQERMAAGHEPARKIYQTIGTYLGYTIPHYCDFYDIRHLMILGRVTSGEGGEIIIEQAREILRQEFPECAAINIFTPSEHLKRHGQAIAAASLPKVS